MINDITILPTPLGFSMTPAGRRSRPHSIMKYRSRTCSAASTQVQEGHALSSDIIDCPLHSAGLISDTKHAPHFLNKILPEMSYCSNRLLQPLMVLPRVAGEAVRWGMKACVGSEKVGTISELPRDNCSTTPTDKFPACKVSV